MVSQGILISPGELAGPTNLDMRPALRYLFPHVTALQNDPAGQRVLVA